MTRFLQILCTINRFPTLEILLLLLTITYMLYRPRGAVERYQLLSQGISTTGEVYRIQDLIAGTYVSYTFQTPSGKVVHGHAKTLDITEYGLSGKLPEKVALTYLPSSPETSTLDTEPYPLESFWQQYLKDYWMDTLLYFLVALLVLRGGSYLLRRANANPYVVFISPSKPQS